MADGEIVYSVKVDSSGAITEIRQAGEQLGSELNSSSEGHSSTWKEIWTGAARQIGAEIVNLGKQAAQALGSAIVDITKSAVESYADYEQLVGGVDTLFKESSDTVQAYAANAYKTAGISANEYMETVTGFSASLLQSLGGDTAAAAQYADMAITDMSDNANKMGTSMESIQNAYQGFAKQNYTMLDNLKLGYGGTKEEMQRLIDDANALNAAQGKLTDYSIDSYADIVSAIHDVQTQMGITGTTAAEAASTIEGSLNTTKAAWSNLLTGLADENADFETLVNNFVDSASNTVSLILPRIKTALNGIVELIQALAPEIIALVPQLVESLLPVIVGVIPDILAAVGEIVSALLSYLFENAPSLIDAGSQMLINLMDGIGGNSGEVISTVITVIGVLLDAIIQNLPDIALAGADMMLELLNGIIDNLPQLISTVAEVISELLLAIVNHLPELLQMGMKILASIVQGIAQAIPQILNISNQVTQSIKEKFATVDWSTLGTNIINGIINGITAGWQWLSNTVGNLARSALQTAKNVLGIHSPSTEFAFVGRMTTLGMSEGVEEEAPDLTRTVTTLYSNVIDDAQDAISADIDYPYANYSVGDIERNISTNLTATASTPDQTITVPLFLDGREIARATAWYTGEQLAWLEA